MAEDDPDDCELFSIAFAETINDRELRFVGDGEELLQYLLGEGQYGEPSTAPRPDLILLDLNMPKVDGREALARIKSNPDLRGIPVVVLTTSKAVEDISHSYDLGAAGYITKPSTFQGLVDVTGRIFDYWQRTVVISPSGA